jgi:hypothetical protein
VAEDWEAHSRERAIAEMVGARDALLVAEHKYFEEWAEHKLTKAMMGKTLNSAFSRYHAACSLLGPEDPLCIMIRTFVLDMHKSIFGDSQEMDRARIEAVGPSPPSLPPEAYDVVARELKERLDRLLSEQTDKT